MHETPPADWLRFEYRDFYDIPRMIAFLRKGRCYVLRCLFDEVLDDYEAEYSVFEVSFRSLDALPNDWNELELNASTVKGHIAVGALRFDSSLRALLDASFIDDLRT
jgi:hypothetical protein